MSGPRSRGGGAVSRRTARRYSRSWRKRPAPASASSGRLVAATGEPWPRKEGPLGDTGPSLWRSAS